MNLKQYLTKRGYFTNLPKIVKCSCKECYRRGDDILLFECEVCDRSVPWCNAGFGDGGDGMCSDCWYQATQLDWVEAA